MAEIRVSLVNGGTCLNDLVNENANVEDCTDAHNYQKLLPHLFIIIQVISSFFCEEVTYEKDGYRLNQSSSYEHNIVKSLYINVPEVAKRNQERVQDDEVQDPSLDLQVAGSLLESMLLKVIVQNHGKQHCIECCQDEDGNTATTVEQVVVFIATSM